VQNGNIKIKELFNGDKIFNIPKYQRAYSWEEEPHLECFLDDLLHQRSDKSYFLGTFLFHERKSRGEYEFIDVVDGQQRLTTIMIFMKVVIGKLLQKNSEVVSKKTLNRYIYDGDNHKLELENEDSNFLHKKIFSDDVGEALYFETPSQKKLYKAKKYFEESLALMSVATLEAVFTVLINSDAILYVVNKISDATQIFELLNDRGRSLTSLESVKSFLMYRIGCLDLKGDGEQSIDHLQDGFSFIYRLVEKYNINEADVLRYHTIVFEDSKTSDYNSPDKFIKSKVNSVLEMGGDDSVVRDYIIGYVDRLKESFILFNEIKENKDRISSLDELFMIGRVNSFFPLMMHVYKNYRDDFDDFMAGLVRFTFRASLIGLRNKNESFYSDINEEENFIGLFDNIFSENWWNINSRVEDVFEYRNYFNWVNKNIIKFILFSYENHLRAEGGYPQLSKNVYFSTDSVKKLSIEHITAQRVMNMEMNKDFEENYLHSLGNLVIDTVSSNSRKGNNSIGDKMDEYIKSPIMSQNEIHELISGHCHNWSNIEEVKLFINVRNKNIINFIRDRFLIKEVCDDAQGFIG